LLQALVVVELATGFFGLVSGSRDEGVFILVHRVAGYAVLAVLAWKARVVLFSLGKPAVGARSLAPGPRPSSWRYCLSQPSPWRLPGPPPGRSPSDGSAA